MTRTIGAGRAFAWAAAAARAAGARRLRRGRLAGGLRSAGIGGKPDEFMVLPTRPLEMPESFAALPPPTPGAVNRVDYRPHAEAVSGLTGRPQVQGLGRRRAGRRGRPARSGDPHPARPGGRGLAADPPRAAPGAAVQQGPRGAGLPPDGAERARGLRRPARPAAGRCRRRRRRRWRSSAALSMRWGQGALARLGRAPARALRAPCRAPNPIQVGCEERIAWR